MEREIGYALQAIQKDEITVETKEEEIHENKSVFSKQPVPFR